MASAASNHAAKRQRLEEAKSSCLVWAKGPFSSKGLRISVVEGVRKFPEDIQRGVEETWQALLEKKPTLFDGLWSLLAAVLLKSTATAAVMTLVNVAE
eukprot:TRINITY_DN34221_c0_g1_i1.p2 TRINITY_DN34221_c0_g1~~TRINITY_DN34221_c0_g1_i1.p2  ORF type:complete len:115 (-),score=23.51 TRINITY_DN34221_c0_g1_i1:132-425(-)